MTYNPNIPLSTDLISVSQGQIKDNFFQLNDQFGKDHIPFNNAGSNGDGHHKQVTIDAPLGADPVVAGTAGVYYTKSDGTRAQGFFINGARNFQLTSAKTAYTPVISEGVHVTFSNPNGTGFYYYSGGLLFVFGSFTTTWTTVAGIGSISISLPVASVDGGQFVYGFQSTNTKPVYPANIAPVSGSSILLGNPISGDSLFSTTIYFHGFYR